jgi:hypothetical protein
VDVHFPFDAAEGLATGDALGQAVFDRIKARSSHGG